MNVWINCLTGEARPGTALAPQGRGWAWLPRSTLAQRRRWLAQRKARRGHGLSGWFGDSEDDFRKKAQDKIDNLNLLLDEIKMGMGGNPDNKVLQQQGPTYISSVQQTINQTNPDSLVRLFEAGGSSKDNAYKMLDEADRVYDRVTEMLEADTKDPTGTTGTAIAKARLGDARAELLRLDKKSEFWEAGGFGGEALGFFENIKKYAKWILIGGGLLLVAPIVLPAVGRAVSSYKAGRSAPATVKANRRRRRR